MASVLGVTVRSGLEKDEYLIMIDPTRRKELIAAATKLFRDGTKYWKPVLDDFPDIPRATAYRIISATVDQLHGRPPRLGKSPEQIEVEPERGSWMKKKPTYTPVKTPTSPDPDHLPIPLQIQKLRDLYDDAVALKERSLDKHGKIKNLAAYQKSIDLRMKLAVADANLAALMVNADRREAVLTSIANIADQSDPQFGLQLRRDVAHFYDSMLGKNK